VRSGEVVNDIRHGHWLLVHAYLPLSISVVELGRR
jgi:hypothetical protein